MSREWHAPLRAMAPTCVGLIKDQQNRSYTLTLAYHFGGCFAEFSASC